MEYRRMGKSGIKLSALSFGAWVTVGNQVSEAVARDCFKKPHMIMALTSLTMLKHMQVEMPRLSWGTS